MMIYQYCFRWNEKNNDLLTGLIHKQNFTKLFTCFDDWDRENGLKSRFNYNFIVEIEISLFGNPFEIRSIAARWTHQLMNERAYGWVNPPKCQHRVAHPITLFHLAIFSTSYFGIFHRGQMARNVPDRNAGCYLYTYTSTPSNIGPKKISIKNDDKVL